MSTYGGDSIRASSTLGQSERAFSVMEDEPKKWLDPKSTAGRIEEEDEKENDIVQEDIEQRIESL